MIYLQRPVKVPPTLASQGKTATDALINAYAKGRRTFNFQNAIYGATDVRSALRTMHQGKCAFCESILPQTTAGHVEHYRPKGEVHQNDVDAPQKPGYFWLAYAWNNLLLACEWCNSRAKRCFFPLADPLKRARTRNDDVEAESPLLLNPSKEDPSLHLKFTGEIVQVHNNSPQGETSIRVYRLDDSGLEEERRKKLHLFRTLRDLAKNTEPTPEVDEALQQAQLWADRIQNGEIEYSAMLRANL